jgi:hypothetical protein
MVDVKPDEISAILKAQLSGLQTANELEDSRYRSYRLETVLPVYTVLTQRESRRAS